MKRKTKGLVVVAAAAAGSALMAAHAQGQQVVIGYSGSTFTAAGDSVSNFYTPVINANGQLAFGAEAFDGSYLLYGPTNSNSLTLLANDGGSTNSFSFDDLSGLGSIPPTLDNNGVVFAATQGGNPGLFRIPLNDSLITVSINGSSLNYSTPSANGGQTAFWEGSPSANGGYFRTNASNVLSTLSPGGTLGTLSMATVPVINSSGVVAYYDSNNIYTAQNNAAATASIMSGETVTVGAGHFVLGSFLNTPDINSAGNLAFVAQASGSMTRGLFTSSSTGTGTSLFVQEGSTLTAGSSPGTLANLDTTALINDAGQVAFSGKLSDDSVGLWIGSSVGNLKLVAKTSDAAPESAEHSQLDQAGSLFADLGADQGFSINSLGDVAFGALLTGGTYSPNQGLFAWTPTDGLQEIARAGDTYSINGTPETVVGFEFAFGSGGSDGLATGLNNSGELVYTLDFEDGSSALLETQLPTAVPEPASLGVLGLAGIALLSRRRRPTMC